MRKMFERVNLHAWVMIGLIGGYFDSVTGKKWGANLIKRKLARDWMASDPSLSKTEIEATFKEIFKN